MSNLIGEWSGVLLFICGVGMISSGKSRDNDLLWTWGIVFVGVGFILLGIEMSREPPDPTKVPLDLPVP